MWQLNMKIVSVIANSSNFPENWDFKMFCHIIFFGLFFFFNKLRIQVVCHSSLENKQTKFFWFSISPTYLSASHLLAKLLEKKWSDQCFRFLYSHSRSNHSNLVSIPTTPHKTVLLRSIAGFMSSKLTHTCPHLT